MSSTQRHEDVFSAQRTIAFKVPYYVLEKQCFRVGGNAGPECVRPSWRRPV